MSGPGTERANRDVRLLVMPSNRGISSPPVARCSPASRVIRSWFYAAPRAAVGRAVITVRYGLEKYTDYERTP